MIAWAIVVLAVPGVRFVVLAPRAKIGFEVFLSLLQLFVALVVALVPDEESRERRRWAALGFFVLGLGGLGFGYLCPLLTDTDSLNTALYGALGVRGLGGLAVALGLVPDRPPHLTGRRALLYVVVAVVPGMVASADADRLPTLVDVANLDAAASDGSAILHGLTAWHWAFGAIALGFGVAAAAGAIRHAAELTLGGWLTIAMTVMAGAQLHALFWPSAYSPIFTTASLLRLAFIIIIAIGAFFKLWRVVADRAAQLAADRQAAEHLSDLARLRADFTAIVAHELASPIAAIRGYATMLTTGALSHEQQIEVAAVIRTETDLLNTLVSDIRAATLVDRDDFAVYPFPVALDMLLADAVAYARTLPGDHSVSCPLDVGARVLADPERIAQVLHNLLNNAAKYSAAGAPIELRAERTGGHVRIEVIDQGIGVPSDDRDRIFEKFGRGRSATRQRITGLGLGLYLSRRILHAHGTDLTLRSAPGEGSIFAFELEVMHDPDRARR